MSRNDDKAATQVLVSSLSESIGEHEATKKELRAIKLASSPVCGAPSDVVLAHHSALVTLVNGQTLLLQSRRADLTVRADAIEKPMAKPPEPPSTFRGAFVRALGHPRSAVYVCIIICVWLFIHAFGDAINKAISRASTVSTASSVVNQIETSLHN